MKGFNLYFGLCLLLGIANFAVIECRESCNQTGNQSQDKASVESIQAKGRTQDSTKTKSSKENDDDKQPKQKDDSKTGKEDTNTKPKTTKSVKASSPNHPSEAPTPADKNKKPKTTKSVKASSPDHPTKAPTPADKNKKPKTNKSAKASLPPSSTTQTKTPTPAPTTTSPTHAPTPAPTSALLADESICLTNPEDIYRTCFQRAIDPNNSLTEDTVQRKKYNIGAALYQRGEDTTAPSELYIAPYTEPYTTFGEDLTYGTVYLSIVRNNNTNLTCNDKIELEETALEWLYVSLVLFSTFFYQAITHH